MPDNVVKNAGAITLLLYAAGYLTVNFYLLQYSIVDISPLRPQYVYTGALLVSFIAVPSLFAHFAITMWTRPGLVAGRSPTLVVRIVLSGVLAGTWIFFLYTILGQTPPLIARGISYGRFWDSLYLAVVGTALGESVILLRAYVKGALPTALEQRFFGPTHKQTWLGVWSWGGAFLMVSLLYVGVFASTVFPTIPVHFGGARPRNVTLIAAPGQLDYLSSIGIRMTASTQSSSALAVAFEGVDFLLLLPRDSADATWLGGPALRLDKSLFAGVAVQPW